VSYWKAKSKLVKWENDKKAGRQYDKGMNQQFENMAH
jgi:hypothetical protein